MKKILIFLIAFPLFAELNIGGSLELYNRYLVGDSSRWVLNRVELTMTTEADLGEHVHLRVENIFTSENFPLVTNTSDLAEDEKTDPVSFTLGDAYADVYGFLLPNLDIRIGRQTINWGTADKINPTSNFNPYDFDDFLSFGDRSPVNALRLFYTLDQFNLEAGFVPVFKPSYIPINEYTENLFQTGYKGIRVVESAVSQPDENLSDGSSFGIRLSSNLAGWDISASYFRGHTKFPIPDSVIITPHDSVSFDMRSYSSFPAIQVLGFDFSGSLFKLGLWGEFGIYFPKEHIIEKKTILGVERDTVLKDPYAKYVIGADYTFRDGTYLNFQFVHGFVNEYGDSLNDYITFKIEKKFLNDRLKVAPLGIALEIPDWSNLDENYGYILNPSISYSPFDNVEFDVGGFVIDGKGENTFARIKEIDELYMKVKVSF